MTSEFNIETPAIVSVHTDVQLDWRRVHALLIRTWLTYCVCVPSVLSQMADMIGHQKVWPGTGTGMWCSACYSDTVSGAKLQEPLVWQVADCFARVVVSIYGNELQLQARLHSSPGTWRILHH